MSNSANYRLIDILKMSTDYLAKKGIENPRLNVELLLGAVLKMDRVQLYLNFEQPLTHSELDQFRELLRRRGNHEPVQYILGETEFYSLKLRVSPATLIPRPETEILVDRAIELCRKYFDATERIEMLDIGTGSGNIAIALAKNIERCFITAIDVQEETLRVARQNAEYHQVADQIEFLKQDIFAENFSLSRRYDVIVSNPPYVSAEEFEQLPREIKDFEPVIALDGGTDGLTFFHRIAAIAASLFRPNGILLVEIGSAQSAGVKQLLEKSDAFSQVEIVEDLNKLPRVVAARFLQREIHG